VQRKEQGESDAARAPASEVKPAATRAPSAARFPPPETMRGLLEEASEEEKEESTSTAVAIR
jgi:hypothetical protein